MTLFPNLLAKCDDPIYRSHNICRFVGSFLKNLYKNISLAYLRRNIRDLV